MPKCVLCDYEFDEYDEPHNVVKHISRNHVDEMVSINAMLDKFTK